MRRLVLAVLLLVPVIAVAGDWYTDNTPTPLKTGKALPPGSDPARYIRAEDWNDYVKAPSELLRTKLKAEEATRAAADSELASSFSMGTPDANLALVTSTGGTTARALKDWTVLLEDVVNVKDPRFAGGARGDGVTDDTAAIAAAVAACGGNKKGAVFFPSGTYKTDTINLPSWCSIVGAGWLNTHLRPLNDDHSVIKLDRAGGAAGDMVEIRDLHIWGHQTGAGHGIEGTGVYASATGPSGLLVKNVYVDGVGGDGVHMQGAWIDRFERVHASNNGGHQFFVDAAINTVVFDSCYARGIPTSGKAGWRVMEGRVTFINCNGIDSGDYWAILGGEVADGDARASNVFAHFIGGNVESAAVAGLWVKRNSQVQIDSTSFVAHANGTSKAISFHNFNNNNPITIGAAVTFGGTWANGFPLHAWTVPGYMKFGAGAGTNSWSDQFGSSGVVPSLYAVDGNGSTRMNGGVYLGTRASAERLAEAISGTATWDPGSVADAAMTSTTVAVAGAALGDVATVSFTIAVPAGALLNANVTATDTVSVTLFNKTGAPLDLASGTLRAVVWKH